MLESSWPLLSLLIWLPIATGVGVVLLGDQRIAAGRQLALAGALLTFLLSLLLVTGFERGTAAMQFVEFTPWVEAVGVNYHLGVDGISMPMVVLTTFSTLLVVVAGWSRITLRPSLYFASFLIMAGIVVGVFSALDGILFYVFFEAVLVPMFLIIGIWGGKDRIYATIKFFLYTFVGSVLMLIALIYLRLQAGSFGILDMVGLQLPLATQVWLFIAFLFAFAIKVPMWPVHTWLPDAHVQAPTGGSVILAAIMLKLGGYGFLRFSLPIVPDASMVLDGLMIVLSLVAVVYVGLIAMMQEDMKKLVAYSSIAHMGFVTLGFFLVFGILANTGGNGGALLALGGGMVQMVSHGFISAAMFLCVGVLYERLHTRAIADFGGVAHRMPVFAGFFVLFAMANAGLPGTSGFVGEFMVILAAFQANFWIALLAAMTLILGAAYSLWMIKRVVYGPVGNAQVEGLSDLDGTEKLVLGVLALAVLWLGLYPGMLVDIMEPSLLNLLETVTASSMPGG